MPKTYKEFTSQHEKTDSSIIQELIDDLPLSEEELKELAEGRRLAGAMKVVAVGMANRVATQARKVLSEKDVGRKIDALAKSISLTAGIASIAVAVSDGGKSATSKIVGISSLSR